MLSTGYVSLHSHYTVISTYEVFPTTFLVIRTGPWPTHQQMPLQCQHQTSLEHKHVHALCKIESC